METKQILVTGGAGFIGTRLVDELRSRGHAVVSLDMFNTDREDYVRADVRSYRQLERVLEKRKFDHVYHLAAEYGRWNGEDYYENLWTTNVVGTKHMIRLQDKLKFKMVFFSSAEVYRDYGGVMTEDVLEVVNDFLEPATVELHMLFLLDKVPTLKDWFTISKIMETLSSSQGVVVRPVVVTGEIDLASFNTALANLKKPIYYLTERKIEEE